MALLAGVLVVIGAAILLTASEVIENLLVAGLFSRVCRRVAPIGIRYATLAVVVGAALIMAGFALLRAGS